MKNLLLLILLSAFLISCGTKKKTVDLKEVVKIEKTDQSIITKIVEVEKKEVQKEDFNIVGEIQDQTKPIILIRNKDTLVLSNVKQITLSNTKLKENSVKTIEKDSIINNIKEVSNVDKGIKSTEKKTNNTMLYIFIGLFIGIVIFLLYLANKLEF